MCVDTEYGWGFNKKYKMILEGARMRYDVIIIGAGPGGIFSAYELTKQAPESQGCSV